MKTLNRHPIARSIHPARGLLLIACVCLVFNAPLAETQAEGPRPGRRRSGNSAKSGGLQGSRRRKHRSEYAAKEVATVLTPEMLEAARVPRGRSSAGKPGTRQLRRKR